MPDDTRTDQAKQWADHVFAHRKHSSFLKGDDVRSRSLWVSCSCGTEVQKWPISITTYQLVPRTVKAWFDNVRNFGVRKKRIREHNASSRAKGLLFRYLTPEQKWSLRSGDGIHIQGGDGRAYHLNQFGGVLLEEAGVRYTLCCHPTDVPSYDNILAQKTMLELDPVAFIEKANVSVEGKKIRDKAVLLQRALNEKTDTDLGPESSV